MTRKTTQKLVISAVFAALCCVATMIIHVPTPSTGGYIHLGDAFVILSGIVLGPIYGMVAAGIGSMLADILSGYAQYALPTFVIKGLSALCCALLFKVMKKLKNKQVSVLISSIPSIIIVALGYFIVEATVFGYGWGALASMPLNILQGVVGMILAVLLFSFFKKIPYMNDLME